MSISAASSPSQLRAAPAAPAAPGARQELVTLRLPNPRSAALWAFEANPKAFRFKVVVRPGAPNVASFDSCFRRRSSVDTGLSERRLATLKLGVVDALENGDLSIIMDPKKWIYHEGWRYTPIIYP